MKETEVRNTIIIDVEEKLTAIIPIMDSIRIIGVDIEGNSKKGIMWMI